MIVEVNFSGRQNGVHREPRKTYQPVLTSTYQVHSAGHLSQKLWGFLTRKERWGLSWRGRLLLGSIAVVAAYLVFLNVHPFLAVTHRVDSNTLVVEGWIQRYALRAAVDEFNRGSYEHVYTTGGPENGTGGYTNDYQTSASIGEEALKRLGLPGQVIQMVPSHVSGRERTYSAAVALRDWFLDHGMIVASMNVLTENCHARRTWLLYQKAFGDKVKVGIITAANPDYNPKDWWRYSDGVREVIGESIAYIYAEFFFWPGVAERREKGDGR